MLRRAPKQAQPGLNWAKTAKAHVVTFKNSLAATVAATELIPSHMHASQQEKANTASSLPCLSNAFQIFSWAPAVQIVNEPRLVDFVCVHQLTLCSFTARQAAPISMEYLCALSRRKMQAYGQ